MRDISSPDEILSRAPDLLYDESRAAGGMPKAVFFPEHPADVCSLASRAAAEQIPLVFAGSQTGITAGSTPIEGCYLVSFSKMGGIHEALRKDDGRILLRCGPGLTLEELDTALSSPSDGLTGVPGGDIFQGGRYTYLPDPTETTASLGGTIATNASGARSFRYGSTRAHVEELSLILAGGDSLRLVRGAVSARDGSFDLETEGGKHLIIPAPDYSWPWQKNASGYYSKPGMDLIDLIIGSEGTLGIIAEAGIILHPQPETLSGISFFPDRRHAFSFSSFLRKEPGVLSIEYFDGTSLDFLKRYGEGVSLKLPEFPPRAGAAIFWEYEERAEAPLEERLEAWDEALSVSGSSLDATWSGFDESEKERLKSFRHAVPELINTRIAEIRKTHPAVRKVGTDAAVPEKAFTDLTDSFFALLEPTGIDFVVFGHLGDYHLHFNLIPKDEAEMEQALDLYGRLMDLTVSSGGTVSAEHGIGKLKTRYLERMYPSTAVERMREIKSSMDPGWIMNRGTLLEDRRLRRNNH